jgi:hypothetical protein
MLGDASSNVHMQYLREGVLMTEAEENKFNQASFIKVQFFFDFKFQYFLSLKSRRNPNIRY